MRRSLIARIALVCALATAFFAGLAVDHVASAAKRPTSQPYRALDVFSDVLAHVENSYVEEVQEKDLVYGAIDGMMARLDPHSVFMRPETYRQMRDETTGEFDGLGLEVHAQGRQRLRLSSASPLGIPLAAPIGLPLDLPMPIGLL